MLRILGLAAAVEGQASLTREIATAFMDVAASTGEAKGAATEGMADVVQAPNSTARLRHLAKTLAALAMERERGGVEQDEGNLAKQVAAAGGQTLIDPIMAAIATVVARVR